MKDIVRTRIAPSPTGFPHLGTMYQAMIDRAWASHNQGTFVVRIEDTDRNRFVEEAESKILQALDWFSITEDEGVRKGGEYSPYRQSERLDIYKKYAEELIEKGHAYYCFCSSERLTQLREEQQAKKQPPMYDKHCRDISLEEAKKRVQDGEKHVVRMKVPQNEKIEVQDLIRGKIEFDSNTIDDQVILKSDGFPTYHLAVVVDDHLMKITHVVRGPEWIPSFPKHKLLYDYFGWVMPVFAHTPLITNIDGSKMSKRHAHANVDWYKQQGFLPEAVLNFISLLGWSHPKEKEIFSFQEFIDNFDLKDLSAVNPKFDLVKLEWMNGQYISKLSDADFYKRVLDFDKTLAKYPKDHFTKVLSLVQERVKKLIEVKDLVSYFYTTPTNYAEIKELATKESKESIENTQNQVKEVIDVLSPLTTWNAEEIDKSLHAKMEESGIKPRQFFMPIRIIATGRPFSPPLGETLEMMGKEEVLTRLNNFIAN